MKVIYIIFLAAILFSSCSKKELKDNRPNIIFIMSDDHAYQAISAYNDKLIETPNIDRIANEGILFTNACVTNSICAPSRATILTGKHSHINGKIDNRFPFDTTNVTFPQILHDAGYQTAMFGNYTLAIIPGVSMNLRSSPGRAIIIILILLPTMEIFRLRVM